MTHVVKTLLAHAEALLSEVLALESPESPEPTESLSASELPDDAIVARYFKRRRTLGRSDRAFIADAVYSVLRRKRSLSARCAQGGAGGVSPRRLLLAALLCACDDECARPAEYSRAEIEESLDETERGAVGRACAANLDALPIAVRLDLPDWIYDRLVTRLGEENAARLAECFKQTAPLDLRVDPRKAKRAEIVARLCAEGFTASACPFSPLGVRLKGKPSLARHPLFLDGSFEVQDEGSQLIGFLLRPKRGETIVDFCAGAGGKTLLFGAMMRSTGRIYAFDVSGKRLDRILPRLARSGLSNVHPIRVASASDARIRRFDGKIDRVFVDAPCSGTGTFRRNPGLKWRCTPGSVAALAAAQAEILESAASLVRPGGRLVYATCSVLDEENDAIARGFLEKHADFTLLPASDILNGYIGGKPFERGDECGSGDDAFLRLSPLSHGVDGFFAAVMERK